MILAIVIAVIGSVLVRYGRLNSLRDHHAVHAAGLQRVEFLAGPRDDGGDAARAVVSGIAGQGGQVQHGDDGLS